MQLKSTPAVGARYWCAIAIASMCGANLGDILPDVLKLDIAASLGLLAAMFALLMFFEKAWARRSEIFYWLAILLVRAAATDIADFSIARAHLAYFVAATLTAVFLFCLIAWHRGAQGSAPATALPVVGGRYWLTMLTAGTLGTLIADGLGHTFHPVQVAVPVSALLATLTVSLILWRRARSVAAGPASYWGAVVAIRWWGTNSGDILAYLLSLLHSASLTAAVLTLIVLIWPKPRTRWLGQRSAPG